MPQIPALLKSGHTEAKKTVEGDGDKLRVNVKSRVCALLLPKNDASVHINKSVESTLHTNTYYHTLTHSNTI